MIKFFNLGLPRSGTTSYSKALNLHGVFDLHFPFKYLTDLRRTGEMRVYEHPTLAWRGLSHANEHANEYERLPDLYPGAKFALTTRGVDGWVESFDALIEKLATNLPRNKVLDWRFELIAGPGYKEARDKGRLWDFFLAHDEAVRTFFGDNLLVLDLLESDAARAEKLAAWLGTEVKQYPHVHDRDGVPDAERTRMAVAAKEFLIQRFEADGYTVTTTT